MPSEYRNRKHRKPPVERNVVSFALRMNDEREREMWEFLEDARNDNPMFSMRDYFVNLWHIHHGNVPNDTNEVASAIVEATQGLWNLFNDLMQQRPTTAAHYRQIVEEHVPGGQFSPDFVDSMMANFGILEDDE